MATARIEPGWRPGVRLCSRLVVVIVLWVAAAHGRATADQSAMTEVDQPTQVYGWAERVTLEPWGFRVKARLDTGANTASIHATGIERFEFDDEPWVRFYLAADPSEGMLETEARRDVRVELPVVRTVQIKRKDSEQNDERLAVHLVFCLDDELHLEQFSLKDREGFNYPILLGRRFLGDKALVDPDRRFLTDPRCGSEAVDAGDEKDAGAKPKES